ncbi:hypothetical protein VPNG_04176 [Cytospora leucostoma]|uniref:HTH CENPB-type domain-containing protein n=1 Tax=Cytospora leucostoma TaxID=1230097 RepID=A0A423XD76_9PEZI|nr:hypothetical protein VPNG_04176 [Cytospora leucostoma]
MAAATATTATASSSSVANGMDNNNTSFTANNSNNSNPVNSNGSGTPQKERHSLSLDQRRALRRWANSQTVRPSHKACIEWFTSQYGQTISQSTVSHSLSPKYARLDGDPQLSGSRLRFGNWPDVEKLVLMWHHGMVNSGRQPTNEELADKAKSIFHQLPRYKDEPPPEFSPGWIHRFKKRYGLLIRRQRRHGTAPPPQDDIHYLVDTVPRFMGVTPDTSPTSIRESIHRIVGIEPSLATCARVRDEVVRRLENPHLNHNGQPNHGGAAAADAGVGGGSSDPDDGIGSGSHHHASSSSAAAAAAAPPPAAATAHSGDSYGEEDPELILQNALHALQQEEADAEAEAAAIREERERSERGLPPLGALGQQQGQQQHPRYSVVGEDLNLTPIPSSVPISSTDRPMRCPFCINQRMLRTIREAVEHMSTHVVV